MRSRLSWRVLLPGTAKHPEQAWHRIHPGRMSTLCDRVAGAYPTAGVAPHGEALCVRCETVVARARWHARKAAQRRITAARRAAG